MAESHVFAQFLIEHAVTRPHQTAILDLGKDLPESISWTQLACAVSQTLERLISLAAKSGRGSLSGVPVGYLSKNDPREIVLSLACQLSGAIEVPLDDRAGAGYVNRCWMAMGGIWCCVDDWGEIPDSDFEEDVVNSSLNQLRDLSDRTNVNDPALVLFTTGTTGEPKGAVLSHRNLVGNAAAKLARVPQSTEDVRMTLLPLAHAYARTSDMGTWLISGCTIALSLGFDGWRNHAEVIQPTLVNAVPRLANRMLNHGIENLNRLRLLGCGGAAMSHEEFQAWNDRGVTVIQGYGLTEASPVICSASPTDATPGFVGKLIDGWDHRIVDGRLQVRGSHTMLGYWPLDTKHAPSEWLDSGDLVEQDSLTGQFKILGRADSMIVMPNGQKIDPVSIERIIESVDGIHHALLLPVDGDLETWVDAEPEKSSGLLAQQISQKLSDQPAWAMPKRLGRLPVPLETVDDALTIKGTIKRSAVTRLAREVGYETMVEVPRWSWQSTGTNP